MKQFVYGALVATAVLGAAGFAVMKEPVAGAKRNVPLAVGDLTLDRAFRCPITLTQSSSTFAATMPSSIGFAITSMRLSGGSPNQSVPIDITVGACMESTAPNGAYDLKFDPPIVVRPNETITLSANPQTLTAGTNFVIGGYYIYPGEA